MNGWVLPQPGLALRQAQVLSQVALKGLRRALQSDPKRARLRRLLASPSQALAPPWVPGVALFWGRVAQAVVGSVF